jgi:DnaA family protein
MTEQLLLPIGFPDSASFENFYPGRSAEVVDGLRALLSGEATGPFYIYGKEGTGKSHLLYSLLGELGSRDMPAAYLSLADEGVNPGDLDMLDTSGWVCIDNIDAWSGDKEKEQNLFGLFERVQNNSGMWVATGSHRPANLGLALADLASRLGSGVVYRLQELNDDERREALCRRAEFRGLRLGDEALGYLLTRTSRNTSDLFALLDRIDRASLLEGRRITVPFLRTLL